MASYRSPGVYREDVFRKPPTRLSTGVPGFVGFADASPGGPPVNTPVPLHRKGEFAGAFTARPDSFLAEAVEGFFDNGGERCYAVRADLALPPARALGEALDALGSLEDLDLVAVPDAVALADEADTGFVQRRALEHCLQHGDRLALLDGRRGATPEQVLAQRNLLTMGQAEPVNGALYYPWLKLPSSGSLRSVPPCGHVAGVLSRTDARVGVSKAPANEVVLGVLDLDTGIDADIQGALNPEGVNCLRAFPGRGIRVWGARTLSREPEWRYVNVRRLFLTLRRWIDRNLTWAGFEPNDPRLWVRIRRELTTYLTRLWEEGALVGQAPTEAFYVKCDAETNPRETREAGRVVTEIGLAPAAPAEFVVVRIVHREAQATS